MSITVKPLTFKLIIKEIKWYMLFDTRADSGGLKRSDVV